MPLMTPETLADVHARMQREAVKWDSYLMTITDEDERLKELARLLLTTYLEGALGVRK